MVIESTATMVAVNPFRLAYAPELLLSGCSASLLTFPAA